MRTHFEHFFGLDQSDCPLPCATFSSEVKILSTIYLDTPGVEISFLPTMEVKSICVSELRKSPFPFTTLF